MTKRLQVLLEDDELAEIRHVAKARRMTISEWVRGAMREARRRDPSTPPERKLAIVRAAANHHFPTADVERMLAEIERGYLTEAGP